MTQSFRSISQFVPPRTLSSLKGLVAGGGTAIRDALGMAMLRSAPLGRPHFVLALTDGRDTTSIVDEPLIVALAEITDAAVGVVVPVSRGAGTLSRRDARDPHGLALKPWAIDSSVSTWLTTIAARSGGTVTTVEAGQSIGAAFRGIIGQFRESYFLTYSPAGQASQGWHSIEIQIVRPGSFVVRARKGYTIG